MKITPKVLSLPPYLSTTWVNISSMHVKEESGRYRLIVLLKKGPQVEIPNLARDAIDVIFNAHAQYADNPEIQPRKTLEELPLSFSLPLGGDGNAIEAFGPTARHNPDQADFPPIPPGILKKIGAIASVLGAESLASLPQAEPGCNCIYCQVVNALHEETAVIEEVTEEDLKFQNWKIQQTADKLYTVTNPLDANEHYNVFLGSPIGCTCGDKHCEHIRAVLST